MKTKLLGFTGRGKSHSYRMNCATADMLIKHFIDSLLPLYRIKTFEDAARSCDQVFTALTLNIEFSRWQRRDQ
mgnify:CR=1 FL=1